MTGVNCLSDNLKRLFWNFKTTLFRLVYIYSKCKKLKTDITFSFISSKFQVAELLRICDRFKPNKRDFVLGKSNPQPNQTCAADDLIFHPFCCFPCHAITKAIKTTLNHGSFLFWLSKSAECYYLEKAMTDVQREAKTLGTPLLTRMIQKSLERTLKRIYTCV